MDAREVKSGSSVFEGWEKWQIALVVGAPVCLGLAGLWYYKKSKSTGSSCGKSVNVNDESKEIPVKVKSSNTNGNFNSSANKSTSSPKKEESPLAQAQAAKDNGNRSFKQGKYADAIKYYTEALQICPVDKKEEISTFYANRAAAYEKLKNPKEVIENCTEALKLNSKYAKALSRRATAAEQLSQYQLSLEDITAVCILEGFQNQTTLQMADRVLKSLGKEKALEALKNMKPGMPSKHFVKSYFASFTEDPVQKCFKVQDVAIEQNDNPEMRNGEIHTNCPFKKAVDCLENDSYDEILPLCEEELKELVQSNPISRHEQLVFLLRGTMYCLKGQLDLALMDLDKLMSIEDLDVKVKVNVLIKRGSLYITQEKKTEGLADFALAASIDPNNSDIYHHRGHQYIQLDQLDDAIKDFHTSIAKNPSFPNSYIQKSYAEHRQAAQEQSTIKLEHAIKSYEETLKQFPNSADAHALYAQALCDLGRFDDADKEFERAITLEPDNANTLVHRGLLKLQWKQSIEEPVELIQKAIKLDERCEFAYEILGTIEVQRGDMGKAIESFEKAIALCKTLGELSHLFSLLHAAKAQLQAAKTLGIPIPNQ